MLVETLLHTRSKTNSKNVKKWKWVAHFPTASGYEALWCLEGDGIRYASIHPRWGRYLAFLGSDMHHSISRDTLGLCAREVEKMVIP
jgi:hypothetical protein